LFFETPSLTQKRQAGKKKRSREAQHRLQAGINRGLSRPSEFAVASDIGSEPSWAQALGVSRTTVREMLSALADAGPIAYDGRRNALLRHPVPTDFYPKVETEHSFARFSKQRPRHECSPISLALSCWSVETRRRAFGFISDGNRYNTMAHWSFFQINAIQRDARRQSSRSGRLPSSLIFGRESDREGPARPAVDRATITDSCWRRPSFCGHVERCEDLRPPAPSPAISKA
jgi:hypothetical protein